MRDTMICAAESHVEAAISMLCNPKAIGMLHEFGFPNYSAPSAYCPTEVDSTYLCTLLFATSDVCGVPVAVTCRGKGRGVGKCGSGEMGKFPQESDEGSHFGSEAWAQRRSAEAPKRRSAEAPGRAGHPAWPGITRPTLQAEAYAEAAGLSDHEASEARARVGEVRLRGKSRHGRHSAQRSSEVRRSAGCRGSDSRAVRALDLPNLPSDVA